MVCSPEHSDGCVFRRHLKRISDNGLSFLITAIAFRTQSVCSRQESNLALHGATALAPTHPRQENVKALCVACVCIALSCSHGRVCVPSVRAISITL